MRIVEGVGVEWTMTTFFGGWATIHHFNLDRWN
jgi:hypothetical protein